MNTPRVGLSLMASDDFARATFPLFESGEVDLLEWSFDTGWGRPDFPEWATALIDEFAAAGALFGHGVTYSPLSARFTPRQSAWLARLAVEVRARRYQRVSEHFGLLTALDYVDSAPLPQPATPALVATGRDRLARLADAAQLPIGLENLALAFSRDDVARQGELLEELLSPDDGYLVLDLHNLYCQLVNFDVRADALLDRYPLERVVELHVSGGSWSGAGPDRIRRDTHDGEVPPDVLALVPLALARCPHVEAVVLERLGGTLAHGDDEGFRADYRALRAAVRGHARPVASRPRRVPAGRTMPASPPCDAALAALQDGLLTALARGERPVDLAHGAWLERAEPRMLDVAAELVRRWGRR